MTNTNEVPEGDSLEKELSFEDQVALANTLLEVVNERNGFIDRQGGFDDFAQVGQYMDGMRESYDEAERMVMQAREEFDRRVPDKETFITKLKSIGGQERLVSLISTMFTR